MGEVKIEIASLVAPGRRNPRLVIASAGGMTR
jgi:hypothetical protein